jgi:predicted 3-demethylubiquinone-9 3-methyltransferase (glyoxalase superfamily)
MPKIHPFLWFDNEAEEAAQFYCALFPNSKITRTSRNGASGPVMVVEFELDGRRFAALNGGPHFKFNEAVSFWISCADQAEVDRYWDGLLAGGGSPSQCGWLKDRFGVSWQVVPDRLGQLLGDPDSGRASRAMAAMMKMVKLDIAALEVAADGP